MALMVAFYMSSLGELQMSLPDFSSLLESGWGLGNLLRIYCVELMQKCAVAHISVVLEMLQLDICTMPTACTRGSSWTCSSYNSCVSLASVL